MVAELRTRPPTGHVPYPTVLVEGLPKEGKSVIARKLSASPRVGRTFVFDVGEVASDEYAALGRFELVEWGTTWQGFQQQLEAALAVPQDAGKPNVVVVDQVTAVWQTFGVAWADLRARRSRAGQKALERDPDAAIDPTMNLWNDAKDRWRWMMDRLGAWPGIAVLVARGGEVAKVEGGQPVAGQTVYRVEAEKSLLFDVTAQVQVRAGRKAHLVAVKSLYLRDAGLPIELPNAWEDNPLDHLVFDLLSAGGTFVPAQLSTTTAEDGWPAKNAKGALFELAKSTQPDAEKAREQAAAAWAAAGLEGAEHVTRDQYEDAAGELVAIQRGAGQVDAGEPEGDPPPEGACPACRQDPCECAPDDGDDGEPDPAAQPDAERDETPENGTEGDADEGVYNCPGCGLTTNDPNEVTHDPPAGQPGPVCSRCAPF